MNRSSENREGIEEASTASTLLKRARDIILYAQIIATGVQALSVVDAEAKPHQKAVKAPEAETGPYTTKDLEKARRIIANGKGIRSHSKKGEYIEATHGELAKTYPKIHIPKLFGFLDEDREVENIARLIAARRRVMERAGAKRDKIDLPLSFVISAICNEGHSLDADHPDYNSLSGFGNFGLDVFSSEFPTLVKNGYLDAGFKNRFTPQDQSNELGQAVKSAVFHDKAAAFEAFVALLANRQRIFREKLRSKKLEGRVPNGIILFGTYKLYNGGGKSRASLFAATKNLATLKAYFKDVNNGGSTGNAFGVLSGSQWLDVNGATDIQSSTKYWWQNG